MLIKNLRDHVKPAHRHTHTEGHAHSHPVKGESHADRQSRGNTPSMSFRCVIWTSINNTSENTVFFRSHANLSFIHGGLRPLSPSLCSPTGGVAPYATPTSSLPPLPCVSDVGCCQISQEGLGAVCLLCKLERRESRGRPERERGRARDTQRERERDSRFKELMTCKGGEH